MKLLLDTHIFIWWSNNSPEISSRLHTIQEAEQSGEKLNISIMTLWEIAMLAAKGRLEIASSIDSWFERLEEQPNLSILPLNSRIVIESLRLGENFPKDPADQLIAATARVHGLRLVTADERIVKSGVAAVL